MHKRLLTLEDLTNYFDSKDISHFSAAESGY